ncbi:MAG: helix-turn-helix transcriptional regulator [Anaerotignum sp.]|nr:helix-turn-helix transcriptional regulator [Anaerotignum sp.]
MSVESIGSRIKQMRKEKGWTQKQLAENAGISEVTVRKYEAESISLELDALDKIAKVLGVGLYELIDLDLKQATKNSESGATGK